MLSFLLYNPINLVLMTASCPLTMWPAPKERWSHAHSENLCRLRTLLFSHSIKATCWFCPMRWQASHSRIVIMGVAAGVLQTSLSHGRPVLFQVVAKRWWLQSLQLLQFLCLLSGTRCVPMWLRHWAPQRSWNVFPWEDPASWMMSKIGLYFPTSLKSFPIFTRRTKYKEEAVTGKAVPTTHRQS